MKYILVAHINNDSLSWSFDSETPVLLENCTREGLSYVFSANSDQEAKFISKCFVKNLNNHKIIKE